ncbi:hypothetical protein BDC45DRAFT_610144 [Circinella umbellata]|nr:hypothetical protein BDC45DRAFT_610144 [Circinella umbellata]
MSFHRSTRNISENDIEFTRNWIRQNLETLRGSEIIFSETYENYCSSCLLKNVPSVAKNSFGPLIIEEFPNSFVSTKFRKKKGFQLYHNIARRYQPSSSDDNTSNNDTVFSTPPEIITMNLFSDNKNDLSVLSLNNKKGEIIQGKYSANGDENGKNNHNNSIKNVPSLTSSSSSLSTTIQSASSTESTNDANIFETNVDNNGVLPISYIRNQAPDETVKAHPTRSFLSNACGFHTQQWVATTQLTNTQSPIFQRSSNVTMVDFSRLYERHCDDILYLILVKKFDMIEECMVYFYQEILLPKFRQLINDQCEEISDLIFRLDTSFYNTLKTSIFAVMSHLPAINHELSASLEKYTKQLKMYIIKALEGYPDLLRDRKIEVARDFSSKIYKHIKLTRLAELVATSFNQDKEFLTYAKKVWKNIDISFIVDNESCSVSQESDTEKIKDILINNVSNLLFHYDDKDASLQRWIQSMGDNIEHFISTQLPTGNNCEFYRTYEKRFVLKWTFYTSCILGEVVMPKAKHFGQFSEFIFFLNELIQFLVDSSITNLIRNVF